MKKEIKKENWVWMPHPAHFIVSDKCRFVMATKIGKYIISTVGEYVPSYQVREIFAKTRKLNLKGMGDAREVDFIKKNGFEKIGLDRVYETMVFKAMKAEKKNCPACPYVQTGSELDMNGYNNAGEAYKGHMKMCKKWSKK